MWKFSAQQNTGFAQRISRVIWGLSLCRIGISLACALALPGFAYASLPIKMTASVDLPAQVAVSLAVVKLGDIARLSSNDLPTLQRLMTLPLGPAPNVASPVILTRARLQDWIRRRLLLSDDQLHWTGAANVALQRAAEGAPTVNRNAWVSLQTFEGPLRLQTRAQVLQNGWTGQQVRVRLAGSSASLLARVVGPNQLELTP